MLWDARMAFLESAFSRTLTGPSKQGKKYRIERDSPEIDRVDIEQFNCAIQCQSTGSHIIL